MEGMEIVLSRFAAPGCAPEGDEIELWATLVACLRPRRASKTDKAAENLRLLTQCLASRPDLAAALRASALRLLRERKQVSLYVSSGLLPSTGFFSETARRISDRLLPDVIDTAYMKDILAVVFHRADDEVWVNALDDELWIGLIETMLDPATDAAHEAALAVPDGPRPARTMLPPAIEEIVESLRVLSFHVSAIGLDPELVRVDPDLEEYESPFLAQNDELLTYLNDYRACWRTPWRHEAEEGRAEGKAEGAAEEGTPAEVAPVPDEKHLVVMLAQCDEVLQRVRRRATRRGTSIALTFKLERLRQHLERIAELLDMLDTLRTATDMRAVLPRAVPLFKELVQAECRRNQLSHYWGQSVELLSLRMTESASKTGEHYITTTRSEYAGMFGSAALGGFIIALMSACKIVLAGEHMAPLNEALSFCFNYGIGFVLIHILGGTVATKQPAMTANAIAASIGEAQGKTRNLENLADIIVRTIRSQLAAIAGNVGVAIPVAILVSLAVHAATGDTFITAEKAHHLLNDVDPLSGAPLFAAVAGVCLFLSGLIAGYYDNLAAYDRIPQRLLQLRWPRRLLGVARMERIAAYVENNLGALAGNFFFGFLLGGVTALGVLFGLPLDIRHIAFSSAYVGYAVAGLGFDLPWTLLVLSLLGVALIGLMNLVVSFSLTLYVAIRARRFTFAQRRSLALLLARRLLKRPQDFLFPPRAAAQADAPAAPETTSPPG